MGQEALCTARFARKVSEGKALLETDHVLFRGDFRVKIPFPAMTSVKANGAWLEIGSSEGTLALNLGPAAEKWAHKILNPPSRLDKLGVKAGLLVSLEGTFESGFSREVRGLKAELVAGRTRRDLIFFAAESAGELSAIPKLVGKLKPDGGLWVVYPKGVKAVREIQVLDAGRAAGLKDVKVASFSPTH